MTSDRSRRAADLVDQAADSSDHWYRIGERLRELAAKEDPDLIGPIVASLQYDFIEPSEAERRSQWGPFGPMLELTDGRVYPLQLNDAPDEWLTVWAELIELVSHPAPRARLHDLLWERRWSSRPDNHARAAIDAYEELAALPWEPLYRAEALGRALELARAVGDDERSQRIIEKTLEATAVSIQSERREPGVALRLIQSVMTLPREEQPVRVDELLSQAESRYAPDPWLLQSISDLQASRAGSDSEAVRSINMRQIDHWRAAAGSASGLIRLKHLETALELARVHGFRDVAESIRKEIQDISVEEMDLKELSTTVEISRERMQRFHDAFLSGANWRECLSLFASYGPPSGTHEENLRVIEELQRDHPLQFLFGRVILGPDNVPIRHANSEAEQREVELSEYEARAIGFWAISAAEVLDRIYKEKTPPTHQELADFFTTSLISPEVADRFARGFMLFWADQPDEASHIVVPRLEAVIREMCRQAGMAIIREPRGRQPGGVRLLGDLLFSLQGRLDESWRRYLVNLLVDPVGTNLRNRIAHALVPRATRQEAALLLHAACFLTLLLANTPPSN